MTIQLADGVPGIIHVHDDEANMSLCGALTKPPLTYDSWDDLLCFACMSVLKGAPDNIEFGDGILQLELFVAGRLARLPYNLYLRTQHWKQMRALAIDRYGRTCVLCDGDDNVNVHHRTYERIGRERLDDLVVLCRKCHASHHRRAS